MMKLASVLWVAALTFTHGVVRAQPVLINADGSAVVTVPDRVVCKPDGTCDIIIVEKRAEQAHAAIRFRVDRIPIVTRTQESVDKNGMFVSTDHLTSAPDKPVNVPQSIRLRADGRYEIVFAQLLPDEFRRLSKEQALTQVSDEEHLVVDYPDAAMGNPEGQNGLILAPECVTINPNGEMRVHTTAIGPVSGGMPSLVRPTRVPVYTLSADGVRSAGVILRNSRPVPVGSISARVPHFVRVNRQGGASIEEIVATETRNAVPGQSATYPPGYAAPDPICTDSAVIYDEPPAISDRGLWNFTILSNAPSLPPAVVISAQNQISAVQSAMQLLLAVNSGVVVADVKFEPISSSGTLAETLVLSSATSYSAISTSLTSWAFFDDESAQEVGMYENLPVGTTVPRRIHRD